MRSPCWRFGRKGCHYLAYHPHVGSSSPNGDQDCHFPRRYNHGQPPRSSTLNCYSKSSTRTCSTKCTNRPCLTDLYVSMRFSSWSMWHLYKQFCGLLMAVNFPDEAEKLNLHILAFQFSEKAENQGKTDQKQSCC